jgi:betaine-aldehyde dehydrogenase
MLPRMALTQSVVRQCLIGGEWSDAADGATAEVISPLNGSVVCEVPAGGPADIDRAVVAAQQALPEWRAMTPSSRSRMLVELAAAIEAHGDEIAHLEALNNGRSPGVFAEFDLPVALDVLAFFAGAARNLEGPGDSEYMPGYMSSLRREPIGVVGQIGPWNFPFLISVSMLSAPLAAGNTIVFKPADQTPLSALMLAKLASEVLPPGVLNVVTGDGPNAGARIAGHPDIGLVDTVGGIETGKKVAAAAVGNLKRTHLELGGNAPVIVFDDADLSAAVGAVCGAGFFNAGQDCGAATRILVQDAAYDEFVPALVEGVAGITVGDPLEDESAMMGPLISARQRERVDGFVTRAREGGASILTGGQPIDRPGFFFEPTVVADVGQDDEIVQDEVFGPVVTVQRFSTEASVVEMANGVKQGLSSSVFSGDLAKAARVADQLQFGTVWINDHGPMVPEMPWGGFRESGGGKQLSKYALEEYTQVKHVMERLADPSGAEAG